MPVDPTDTPNADARLVEQRIAKHLPLLDKLADQSRAERQAKFYADNPDLRPMTDEDIPF